jgi:conjugal transfer ATP-binding protein TraC
MNLVSKLGDWISSLSGDGKSYGVNIGHSVTDFKKLSDYEALSSLLPYQAFDSSNNIFINDQSIGFGLEIMPITGCSKDEIDRIYGSFNDKLPETGFVHIQLISDNKVGAILDRFFSARSKCDISNKLAAKRVEYYKKCTKKSVSNAFPFYIRNYRVFIYYCEPIEDNYDLQVEKLNDIRSSWKTSLSSITPVIDLSVDNFLSCLRDIINPRGSIDSSEGYYDVETRISDQITRSDTTLDISEDNIYINSSGEKYVAQCFNVERYPEQPALWQMRENIGKILEPAMQLSCPFIVNMHFRACSKSETYQMAQQKFLFSEKKAHSPMVKLDPDIRREHQEWEHMREEASQGARKAEVVYQITTFSSEDNYKTDATRIKDVYSSNKWIINIDRGIQNISFLCNLPFLNSAGLFDTMGKYKRIYQMKTFNAVNILPIVGEWKGLGGSDGMMYVGRSGQVATLSNFANTDGNYNIAVAAKSRAGKSFMTQEIIFDTLSQGGIVRVIDLGRSYEKFCKTMGGQFIEMKEGVCINPFTHVKSIEDSIDQVAAIIATMAHPGGTSTDKEISFITISIQRAWDKKGNKASVSDVSEELAGIGDPVAEDLILLLRKYTKGGQHGKYFEGDSTIDVKNKFIVLELQEVSDKQALKAVVVLSIMLQITEEFDSLPRDIRKMCVIDEAWDLLHSTKETAKFISSGYRRVAKHNGAFVTIVQSINDYFKDELSIAVFENSDIKIILAQLDSTIDDIKKNKRLNFTPYEETLLRSFAGTKDYKECLIKTPSSSGVFRILFDPFTRILYSTRAEEFEAVNRLVNSGLSMEDAVDHVAKNVYGE